SRHIDGLNLGEVDHHVVALGKAAIDGVAYDARTAHVEVSDQVQRGPAGDDLHVSTFPTPDSPVPGPYPRPRSDPPPHPVVRWSRSRESLLPNASDRLQAPLRRGGRECPINGPCPW